MDEKQRLLDLLAEPRGDEEVAHGLAEDALCVYLRSIGENEIADAWVRAADVQNWWYA